MVEVISEKINWHDIFEYQDGELIWKIDSFANKVKGKKAGALNNTGYLRTKYNKKKYLNHRIIFEMFNGYIPEFIDHIDRNRLNNKIENLRPATRSLNAFNRSYKKNDNLPKGIYRDCNKFRVHICGKYIGLYNTLNEAINIRLKKEKETFDKLLGNT